MFRSLLVVGCWLLVVKKIKVRQSFFYNQQQTTNYQLSLDLHLREVQFDRSLATEDRDLDLQLLFVHIDFPDEAGEVVERSVDHLHRITLAERLGDRLDMLTLLDAIEDLADLVGLKRRG